MNDDFDDASPRNIEALLAKANDLVSTQGEHIKAVAQLLEEPRSPVAGGGPPIS